jgi:hypothetical protein
VETLAYRLSQPQRTSSGIADEFADVVEDRTGLHRAADGLRTAAEFLRRQDVKALVTGLVRMAKKHPGAALAIAAAAGFVLARRLARD